MDLETFKRLIGRLLPPQPKENNMRATKRIVMFLSAMLLVTSSSNSVLRALPQAELPNPVLYLLGQESVTTGGKNFVRYKYDVLNKQDYPAEMFAAAPGLPPCGANTKASRTWVDFFDMQGKRLYGFCALAKPADLNGIWFAVEEGKVPPSYVYIEMSDRQTNKKYKSNLAETTQ